MTIVVDRERCQGHGRCYDKAPDVFGADEDGYVVLLMDVADRPDLVAQALTAVRNCPERALALEGEG